MRLAALLLLAASAAADVPGEVKRLSHPRYAVREAAVKALIEAGSDAKPAVMEAVKSGDAETSERAKAALAGIVAKEVESLRPLPELDGAWYVPEEHHYGAPDPAMYPYLQSALQLETTNPDPPPYWKYYLACDWWVRDRLSGGESPADLRPVLAEMHRRDQVFLKRNCPARMVTVDADAYAAGK